MTIKIWQKACFEQFVGLSPDTPLQIIWIRRRLTSSIDPYPLAYHPEIEFQYIKHGTGSYFINGSKHPFVRKSVLVIRPGETHKMNPENECLLEKCALLLAPAFIGAGCKRWLINLPRHVKLLDSEADYLEILLKGITGENGERSPFWKESIRLKLKELIFIIKRAGLRSVPPPLENPIISQVISVLDRQYSQSLSVPSIARTAGLSEGYLSRLFKKCTGMGVKQYVLHRRIMEAKKLLNDEPHLKLDAIAERVGFNEYAVFHRDFKKIVTLTPAIYRRIVHKDVRKRHSLQERIMS